MFDVITEVLERHAAGITFREENAGFDESFDKNLNCLKDIVLCRSRL